MTNTRTVQVTCPSCHAQGEFTVYKSINTKESPALKEKVRDGSLFQFTCPACGAKTTVDYPFLYHQPEDHYMINYGKLEDGAKALEILKANPDIGLVVTDYNMPDIDGFELTRRIRTVRGSHELRIIGVSSSTNRLLSARFLKAGGNDFMLRPFIDEEFYCRVNQNLDTLTQIRTAQQRLQA